MFGRYNNHTNWDNVSFTTFNGLNRANYTTGNDIKSFPTVVNGYVYVGSYDNAVYQLNATNISQLIANYTTSDDILSSPAVANNFVYVGSKDNAIYQLNATNISQLIANYTTGDDVISSPAVANGYVYIGSLDNAIYQLNATNISLDNDLAPPVITLISPATATSATTSAYNFTFNLTDASTVSNCSLILDNFIVNILTGINSTGGTNGMYNSSLSVSDHTWKISCTDIFGNTNTSATRTFTVSATAEASSSSGGGGGSSSVTQTYSVSEKSLNDGNKLNLNTNDKISFAVQASSHTLTLNKFNSTTATVKIQSDPITAVLEKGISQKFDINNDSVNDLIVRYDGMSSGKAMVFLQSIEKEQNSSLLDTGDSSKGDSNVSYKNDSDASFKINSQADSESNTPKTSKIILIFGAVLISLIIISLSVVFYNKSKK